MNGCSSPTLPSLYSFNEDILFRRSSKYLPMYPSSAATETSPLEESPPSADEELSLSVAITDSDHPNTERVMLLILTDTSRMLLDAVLRTNTRRSLIST